MEAIRLDGPKHITREEICVLLGITKSRLSELIRHHKYLAFPDPVHIRMHHQYYNREKVLAWDKVSGHRDVKWTQPPKPTAVKLDKFDNELAAMFIKKPAIPGEEKTFSSVIKKHLRGTGKTTVVHLKERNDYTPPHSGLALFRQGDSYRVSHDGVNWL